MKLNSLIVLRPVCLFILLGLLVLFIPSLVISTWCIMTKRVENVVKMAIYDEHNESMSVIETAMQSLLPINSSAPNFARVLSVSLNDTELSFSLIETAVAPNLFILFSTVSYISQVSYIGLDGLFFSYYQDGVQTRAVYSNTSYPSPGTSSNSTTTYNWYTQLVDVDTGIRYGEPISLKPMVAVNASWLQKALNSSNGSTSLGMGWGKDQELLFLNTAAIDERGAISIGFPMKDLMKLFSYIYPHGGDLYIVSKNGEVLTQTGLSNTRIVLNNGTAVVQLMTPSGDLASQVVNVLCKLDDNQLNMSKATIQGTKYMFYCRPLDIIGVQSVYILAFRYKGLVSYIHKDNKISLILLLLMLVSVVLSILLFLLLIIRAAKREMFLCAALIKQMEATQQAERKSMNKSLAFARASHDIRGSLAAITGLIDLCRVEVSPESEFDANLVQIKSCAEYLRGILNSVLDTSKIEAGRMQLEENEFNLAQLIDHVVDMYYQIGMKKGVDVLWDPCDGSIFKSSIVKADPGKLKQILCNLISNAIKFTSEGHVSLRAWVKKPSLENSILASKRKGLLGSLSQLIYKNTEAYNNLNVMHTVQQKTNVMEFVFEVDDTGIGIPKEKRKSVFENFVQVNETNSGQEGTGLGLGIVQSMVRLMGGEIGIVDKELGERGTCFKFNLYLSTCEDATVVAEGGDTKFHGDHILTNLHQHSVLSIWSQSPKSEGSQVVLLIQSEERRRISQKLIESLGIRVSIVNRWKDLHPTLEKIKHKSYLSYLSSSGKSEFGSLNDYSSNSTYHDFGAGAKDIPLSMKDGADNILPVYDKKKSGSSFTLIVVDVTSGPFDKIRSTLCTFIKDLQHNYQCKIVWLDTPIIRSTHLRELEEYSLDPCYHIVTKPFHGFRLYEVLKFLPEFGGTVHRNLSKSKKEPTIHSPQVSQSQKNHHSQQVLQKASSPRNEKPLNGRKVLVVDDDIMLRKITKALLSRLGATVESCNNGEEALKNVCEALHECMQRIERGCMALPYDFILMDCQMGVMDGYEATRQIRLEERRYNIRLPIIALTAHEANTEESKKVMQAGMDFHLTKPLNKDQLLEVITFIDNK